MSFRHKMEPGDTSLIRIFRSYMCVSHGPKVWSKFYGTPKESPNIGVE